MSKCDFCKGNIPDDAKWEDRNFHNSAECLKHPEFTQ